MDSLRESLMAQFRAVRDPRASIARRNTRRGQQTLGKHMCLVSDAIMIGIFDDDHSIRRRGARNDLWIDFRAGNPQSPRFSQVITESWINPDCVPSGVATTEKNGGSSSFCPLFEIQPRLFQDSLLSAP